MERKKDRFNKDLDKNKLNKKRENSVKNNRNSDVKKKDHFETTKTTPNYKDVLLLRRFLTDKFKIQNVSRTGLSSKNQRKLAAEIKKARYMGLLPYTDLHSQL
jgi:small subunit ribosomal protein S18